jgi:uncharacterized integral membrane protein (TIGR00698 family)
MSVEAATPHRHRAAGVVATTWPGVAAAAALAMVAAWIAGGLGDPLARNPVLVAMLFGLLLGNILHCPERLLPGFDFTKRYLLRAAVALVGLRVTVGLLADLGIAPLVIAAIELVVVLVLLRWIAISLFKLDRDLALLIAAGTAVCGAAAILAVAALLQHRDQRPGIAVALITLAGTIALLVYPEAFLAGWLPGLDDHLYGVFVGASIYELAQVYGASYAVSEGALNTATLVKLSKVVLLIPLLLVLDLARRSDLNRVAAFLRRAVQAPLARLRPLRGTNSTITPVTQHSGAGRNVGAAARPAIQIPWFIVAFVGLMLLNTTITLNPTLRRAILDVDQFLFLMVMVALGMTTQLSRIGEVGGVWRIAGIGTVGLVLTTGLTYALVRPLASPAANARAPLESKILAAPDGRLFISVGCAKCHVPVLQGRNGPVTVYSDLLLHQMGPALDDKIMQGTALGTEWRTTPLIGISKRSRYLHDGRAKTIREAIHGHGGEAEIVQQRFFSLPPHDQKTLMDFVAKL